MGIGEAVAKRTQFFDLAEWTSNCCDQNDPPVALEFLYSGDDCSVQFNEDPTSECKDEIPQLLAEEVYVVISSSDDFRDANAVWKKTKVNLGSTFFFTVEDTNTETIPSNTNIHIFSDPGFNQRIQYVSIKTDCSIPLYLNDQWGSMQLHSLETSSGTRYTSSQNSLLPLSFVEFDAEPKDKGVELEWVVSGDLFRGKMEVQRSRNGLYFDAIATLPAFHSDDLTAYFYKDLYPLSKNYYRLKIFREDGFATFSQIELVEYGDFNDITAYPNPASEIIFISKLPGDAEIEILNLDGIAIQHSFNPQTHFLNISALPPAHYFIVIRSGDMTRAIKFIKT